MCNDSLSQTWGATSFSTSLLIMHAMMPIGTAIITWLLPYVLWYYTMKSAVLYKVALYKMNT